MIQVQSDIQSDIQDVTLSVTYGLENYAFLLYYKGKRRRQYRDGRR